MLASFKKWFKKDTLKLTFYTYRPEVYEYFKIQPTRKFQPKWLKTILKNPDWRIADRKNNEDFARTLRTCNGFQSIMGEGYTLPLWTDIKIELNPIGEKGYESVIADEVTKSNVHPPEQRGDFLPPTEYDHMKIISPWMAVCSEPIKFWYGPNAWTQPELGALLLPSAVVDYYYQNATNINMIMIKSNYIRTIDLEAGTPMIQMIPLTEREIEMECKLVSLEEFERIHQKNRNVKFKGSMYDRIKRCPFHKG